MGRIRTWILRAQLHRTIQTSVQNPDLSVSDQLATSSSLQLPVWLCSFARAAQRTHGGNHIYWFIVRPQTRIWMKTHVGPSDRCLAAPSIWSSSSSLSSVSIGSQKLPEPFHWGFMEMSLHRHDWSMGKCVPIGPGRRLSSSAPGQWERQHNLSVLILHGPSVQCAILSGLGQDPMWNEGFRTYY